MVDATKPVACGACKQPEELTPDYMGASAYWIGPQAATVRCGRCGCRGPLAQRVESAIAAWNAMWAGRAGEATKGPVGAAPFRDDRWILGRAAYEAAVACHQVQGIQVRKLHHWDDLGDSDRELYCQMAEGVMGKAGELGIAPSPDGGEGVGPRRRPSNGCCR